MKYSGQGNFPPDLRSSDLPIKRLLGKGLASIGYETEWKGVRYAKKDFVAVPSDIFRKEAGVLLDLPEHDNVVKTHGLTVDKLSCSLVLGYMDDKLTDLIQKRKDLRERSPAGEYEPTLQELLDLILRIARAMEHLHKHGIIHGDLKSRNILVNYMNDGDKRLLVKSVKVADFGLVQTKRNSMPHVSHQARKLDMVRWKAPEHLMELYREAISLDPSSDSDEDFTGPACVTHSDDAYCFGLTCFQILTGEEPHSKRNWKELVKDIVSNKRRICFPENLPQGLRELLDICCDADPNKRPTFSYIRKKLEHIHSLLPGIVKEERIQHLEKVLGGRSGEEDSELPDSVDSEAFQHQHPKHEVTRNSSPTTKSQTQAASGEYASKVLKRRANGNLEAKRGNAVFISMENYPQGMERLGAQVDRGKLEALFKTLLFDVIWFVDEEAEQLKRKLIRVSEKVAYDTSYPHDTKKKKLDCFVCFVSAHGNTDEHGHYIKDTSGKKVYTINDILKPFMTCDGLKGVPKVFFINACRGSLRSTDSMVEFVKRSGKDSLVVFSTEEGYESARCSKNGTLFAQALWETVLLNHERKDVGAMIRIANDMLRKESEKRFRTSAGDKKKRPATRCQVAPSHCNLTGNLYWRTQGPSESSPNVDNNGIVGQDGHREKLKKWSMSRKKAGARGIESQSFGISGMGGIGKTTLAKSLYEDEEIKEYYDHRVYWVTVKKNPDILTCQRRLISEICKETPSARLDTEKLLLGELKKKLLSERKKILLFLDDVWDKDDVEKLLGDPFLETLPRGSKCIITSRKPAELAKLVTNAGQIEKLDLLEEKDARTLFCIKAFSRAALPDILERGLKDVVEEVIDACGRMPILLTTLGADLWGIRSIESWGEVRDRLRAITDKTDEYQKLIEQLMISYDDLPEGDGDGINLKDFFLDFAAFPEREEIEIAVVMDMWTKPGVTEDEAYRALEELEQRCVVKIDGYWCYVHDVFRSLAVKIVEGLSLRNRRRLFAWGMSNSTLPEKWDILQNARSQDGEPVMFETEKMVISRSGLKEFHPRDSVLFPCLTRLRMLLLTSNLNLVALPPEIGCLTSLEKLDLSWCLGLKVLPGEIGQLESLQKLNMAGCCSLTALPAEVGRLKKLMELNMQSCGIKELPEEIGELTCLRWLCLNDCNELEVLPDALGKLRSLVRLECDMLLISEIPKALGNLSNLESISFAACGRITRIPTDFVKLTKVTSMCFAASHQLKSVPDQLDMLAAKGTGSLTVLNVCNTKVAIEELPPNLCELQKCYKGNSRDPTAAVGKLHGVHNRGVLVDTASVFDPSNKEERRASFGLARIIFTVKTEPFLSWRFDTAIRIMYTMANHDGTRHAIVRSGGLPVLLRCIDKSDPQRCGEYAAATLRNICLTYSTHQAVVDAGGLELLTRVLHRKNDIRFYAYQALVLITNGDVDEGDYAFTTEIYDRCGHSFGYVWEKDVWKLRRCIGPCIYCVVEQDLTPAVKTSLKS